MVWPNVTCSQVRALSHSASQSDIREYALDSLTILMGWKSPPPDAKTRRAHVALQCDDQVAVQYILDAPQDRRSHRHGCNRRPWLALEETQQLERIHIQRLNIGVTGRALRTEHAALVQSQEVDRRLQRLFTFQAAKELWLKAGETQQLHAEPRQQIGRRVAS
jgi:hypothetical protein